MPSRARRLSAAIVLSAFGTLSLAACSSGQGGLFGSQVLTFGAVATTAPTASPTLDFNSEFTDMGSIHPTVALGDQLELELDMWTEQKTHEWFTNSEKRFSFVINVYDRAAPVDAPFDSKREVYMSNITVTSTTSGAPGVVENPYSLNADPRSITLDPEALSSQYGLLVTSPKGGLQIEDNVIGTLATGTTGVTLDFSMTVSTETAPGSGSFSTQTVHQVVPVAIYPAP